MDIQRRLRRCHNHPVNIRVQARNATDSYTMTERCSNSPGRRRSSSRRQEIERLLTTLGGPITVFSSARNPVNYQIMTDMLACILDAVVAFHKRRAGNLSVELDAFVNVWNQGTWANNNPALKTKIKRCILTYLLM